jgi:DNA mismatch repair protein MutL
MTTRVPAPVKLLDPDVIHRIAAGEVVEGPASIVKELVENSLDAGARSIKVVLVEGGLVSLTVEDDGWGFSKSDLASALQRHATSKIRSVNDLEAILSLGFRGEALSAAGAVSRLTIDSFREGEGAWNVEVRGGAKGPVKPGTRKIGTKISVEDLFFNVPARRKFLRKPGLEAQDAKEALEALSLCHPEVRFEWHIVSQEGELKHHKQLAPSTLEGRFADLAPAKGELIRVASEKPMDGVLRLEMVGLRPPAAARSAKGVRLALNGRPIQDKRLPYVAREAFGGLIEVGHFPFLQIAVEVDPGLVDVNVHPQKKEVRWPSGFSLGGLVYGLLRSALEVSRPATPAPSASHQEQLGVLPFFEPSSSPNGAASSDSIPAPSFPPFFASAPTESAFAPYAPSAVPARGSRSSLPKPVVTPRPPFRFSQLRVVGEIGAAWIVCESPRGLVLVDQHAAHERVNYERCLKGLRLVRSKPLLVPIEVEIPYAAQGATAEIKPVLEGLGFEFSEAPADPRRLELIAVPEADRKIEWSELVDEVFEDFAAGGVLRDVDDRLRVRLAASIACHGSVRRGQRLSVDEIQALFRSLDEVDWSGLCPHGRPLWFEWNHEQIESAFHR